MTKVYRTYSKYRWIENLAGTLLAITLALGLVGCSADDVISALPKASIAYNPLSSGYYGFVVFGDKAGFVVARWSTNILTLLDFGQVSAKDAISSYDMLKTMGWVETKWLDLPIQLKIAIITRLTALPLTSMPMMIMPIIPDLLEPPMPEQVIT